LSGLSGLQHLHVLLLVLLLRAPRCLDLLLRLLVGLLLRLLAYSPVRTSANNRGAIRRRNSRPETRVKDVIRDNALRIGETVNPRITRYIFWSAIH
jgi:hypothetical protein